jgi:hypothetical protein
VQRAQSPKELQSSRVDKMVVVVVVIMANGGSPGDAHNAAEDPGKRGQRRSTKH